ncbi:MAG: hypothetical protein RMN52_03330 [Anaerolineae bacterium]|nr:hypothetical protein [Candidatus Roseilinea sp.]MDW8449012.1 hypothetical protein [Anaerolineae bacterium]
MPFGAKDDVVAPVQAANTAVAVSSVNSGVGNTATATLVARYRVHLPITIY